MKHLNFAEVEEDAKAYFDQWPGTKLPPLRQSHPVDPLFTLGAKDRSKIFSPQNASSKWKQERELVPLPNSSRLERRKGKGLFNAADHDARIERIKQKYTLPAAKHAEPSQRYNDDSDDLWELEKTLARIDSKPGRTKLARLNSKIRAMKKSPSKLSPLTSSNSPKISSKNTPPRRDNNPVFQYSFSPQNERRQEAVNRIKWERQQADQLRNQIKEKQKELNSIFESTKFLETENLIVSKQKENQALDKRLEHLERVKLHQEDALRQFEEEQQKQREPILKLNEQLKGMQAARRDNEQVIRLMKTSNDEKEHKAMVTMKHNVKFARAIKNLKANPKLKQEISAVIKRVQGVSEEQSQSPTRKEINRVQKVIAEKNDRLQKVIGQEIASEQAATQAEKKISKCQRILYNYQTQVDKLKRSIDKAMLSSRGEHSSRATTFGSVRASKGRPPYFGNSKASSRARPLESRKASQVTDEVLADEDSPTLRKSSEMKKHPKARNSNKLLASLSGQKRTAQAGQGEQYQMSISSQGKVQKNPSDILKGTESAGVRGSLLTSQQFDEYRNEDTEDHRKTTTFGKMTIRSRGSTTQFHIGSQHVEQEGSPVQLKEPTAESGQNNILDF